MTVHAAAKSPKFKDALVPHCRRFALSFPTGEKEVSIMTAEDHQKLLERIAEVQAERSRLFEQIAPIQQRLGETHDELTKLQAQEQRYRIQHMGETPDWPLLINELASNGCSRELYNYAERHLRQKFDMFHSGFWIETEQASFKLKVERNPESKTKNLAGLKFFAPLFKPHGDGWVHFQLFEYSLSIGGSYHLLVKPDLSQIELALCRGSRRTTLSTFKTPEEAIDYIAQHHWYGNDE